jgi:hypothetical protein
MRDLRLGTKGGSSVWYYTGVIRNPVSGMEVAGIEGVERCMEVPSSFFDIRQKGGAIAASRDDRDNSNSFSYLSSKLFAYTELHNHTAPITAFRVQPTAPARHVDPVNEMNTVVTLGYRRRSAAVGSSNNNNNQGAAAASQRPFDFFSVVQWPSGRVVHTNKIDISPSGSSSPQPSPSSPLYASSSSPPPSSSLGYGGGLDVLHYMNGVSATRNATLSSQHHQKQEQQQGESSSSSSSKGKFRLGKWVSFRGSGNQPWYGKTQEYYSLAPGGNRAQGGIGMGIGMVQQGLRMLTSRMGSSGSEPGATMRYKRFGEGPEWYVFCYIALPTFLVFDVSVCLSLSRSITACLLHSLTPHDTSLTIVSPSINKSIDNTHITYYLIGTPWAGLAPQRSLRTGTIPCRTCRRK